MHCCAVHAVRAGETATATARKSCHVIYARSKRGTLVPGLEANSQLSTACNDRRIGCIALSVGYSDVS